MNPPIIDCSTKEEREEYIKEKYKCKSSCEICGNCKVFKGKSAETVFVDYIEGLKEYNEVLKEYR